MNRSLLAIVLAPLALVIACGGDDGSGDNGLFQSYGGASGKDPKSPFQRPDDEESPIVDGDGDGDGAGEGGEGGSTSGASSKGGATSKGGTGGTSSKGGGGGKAGNGGSSGSTGGATSKGGSGGTGGTTSKGGSSGTGGTGGTTSKGGSSGTGGTTGKGGSGGTSSAGGSGGASPYEGSIVPSTCEETHGSVGCCGPDNRAYYLEDDGSIAITPCTNGKVCGWRADTQWYSCVDAVSEDPAGIYPLTCGGAVVAGACEAGSSGKGGSSGTGGSGGKGGSSGTGGKGGSSGKGGTGGSAGTSSGPPSGGEWSKCTYAYDCLAGLVCSAGYCQKPTGTGAGSNSGSTCQAKGGYGGLGCTGQFVLGCQQIGCGCCESGGVGQCCLRYRRRVARSIVRSCALADLRRPVVIRG